MERTRKGIVVPTVQTYEDVTDNENDGDDDQVRQRSIDIDG